MSIEIRNNSYRVRKRINGRTYKRTFHSKEEALRWLESLEKEQEKEYTVNSLCSLYLHNHIKTLSTTTTYPSFIEKFRLQFGAWSVGRLTRYDCLQWLASLTTLSGSSINRHHDVCRAMFNWAIRLQLINVNPFDFPKTQKEKSRGRVLQPYEQEILMLCLKRRSKRFQAFVKTALLTGARAGELRLAGWNDLNYETQYLELRHTKNGKPRLVPVDIALLQALPKIGPLIFGDSSGRPLEYQRMWRRLRVDAGLPTLRFHDLRHTAATRMAQHGATAHQLMIMFGWTSISMTQRYTHLKPDESLETMRNVLRV